MRTLIAALAALPFIGATAAPAQPVVLELFTSQGCSSCPPADLAVAKAADRPDVIALSFGVTYWNDLGWKDTFAKEEYTARQHAYAARLGGGSYTPEVVAGGRVHGVGNTPAAVASLIARGRTQPVTSVTIAPGKAQVGAGLAPKGGADVWLVRYDPRTAQVPVKAGENSGKTLPIRNVVKQLRKLGDWSGQPASFSLPPAGDGLKTVVLVQGRRGGPILAAAAV